MTSNERHCRPRMNYLEITVNWDMEIPNKTKTKVWAGILKKKEDRN